MTPVLLFFADLLNSSPRFTLGRDEKLSSPCHHEPDYCTRPPLRRHGVADSNWWPLERTQLRPARDYMSATSFSKAFELRLRRLAERPRRRKPPPSLWVTRASLAPGRERPRVTRRTVHFG